MSTSSFSFNNDNSGYINLETILGCTVGSRAENGLVFLDEEKPCGTMSLAFAEISFITIQFAQFNYPVITSF